MKPHGLDLILKEELLDNGKVVHSSENPQNNFEGLIGIRNNKSGKYIELPMRSFVGTFMDRLHGMLSGDGGTDTRLKSASNGSAASLHRHRGLVLGTGSTPPQLSDTTIETIASHASLAGTLTTFQAPTVILSEPVGITSEIRRLFQNNRSSAFYITEAVLYGKDVISAASGAATGRLLYARDLLSEGEGGFSSPITFSSDSDMRFDFKFNVAQGANGGLNTNFSRLIHNLFFKGAIVPTGSQIRNYIDGITSYTYGTTAAAVSASTRFFYAGGGAPGIYGGIVVGESSDTGTPPPLPPPSPDETSWAYIRSNEFSCSANTISAVSSNAGKASFSITRTFTNNQTYAIYLDRVGILCRGNSASLTAGPDNTQFFIVNSLPTGGLITIQPSQVYRITFTFQIQV